jgi:multidrug efflux pump subunit AcrB
VGTDDNTWMRNFISSVKLPPYVKSFNLTSESSYSGGGDLMVALQGGDENRLNDASDAFISEVMKINGVKYAKRNKQEVINTYSIKLTEGAKISGLTEAQVSSALTSSLTPSLAANIVDGNFVHSLVVSVKERNHYDDFSLRDVPLVMNDKVITLSEVANIVPLEKENNFLRINGIRSVELIIGLTENGNANEIQNEIDSIVMPNLIDEYSISIELSGSSQAEERASSNLMNKSIIALVLIYVILSISFNSYIKPLLIMTIIPFSIMGSILGHYIIGFDLNFLSILAIFGLSGIVVNNTIAITHEYSRLQSEFKDKAEAMVMAIKNRFRAILVTTVTTVAGLAPLLMSVNVSADYLKPMAISIVFGLIFSVLMVCYTYPVMLLLNVKTNGVRAVIKEHLKLENQKIRN